MKQSLSENRLIFFFMAIALLFLITGIFISIAQFSIIGLILLIVALWIYNSISSVDFDSQRVFITKKGKSIEVPLHKVEWISELNGRGGMSLCFLGFKSSTILGSRVMFLGLPFRQSIDLFVETAKNQGVEIKVNRP